MRRLRITLRRSTIGYARDQKQTARALGLTRLHRTVVRPDNPAIRGMVNKLRHLVSIEETEEPDDSNATLRSSDTSLRSTRKRGS